MDLLSLLLLAAGLSMDAFAVSLCKGLSVGQVRMRHMALAGVWFGGFQALMPVVGYLLGMRFQSLITSIDHWIAFALLAAVGIGMIRDSRKESEPMDADMGPGRMLTLAVATSIDALAVGISFAFIGADILLSACVIGVTTFLFSAAGMTIGGRFGSRLGRKASLAGGIVLIAIGVRILMEHLAS